jgi:SAM-dependent methyltransferase
MEPGTFHDFERDGWERAAEYYGDAFGGLTAQTITPLLKAAGVTAGMRVLDVASGPGGVAAAAAEWGAVPVGVDFSEHMVALSRREYPTLTFEAGDAEALQFADGSFDAVVINFGVLHLARPDAALEEARRVLVPGGRCAFTVWAKPETSVGFGIVLGAIERLGRMDVPLPEGPPFFRFSDGGEAVRSMLAAGFADARVEQVPLVWCLPSAGALFDAFANGAVRTAALLRGQTPDALVAIHTAIVEEAATYRQGDIIELPMAAVLTSGAKPA